MIKLVISLQNAPTDNRRLIASRGRFISSNEYRAWKEESLWKVKAQWGKRKQLQPTFENQLSYHVKVFMSSKRTDQVNWDKGARDILTAAGVWDDDKWTFPAYSPCEIDALNPRMEITFDI